MGARAPYDLVMDGDVWVLLVARAAAVGNEVAIFADERGAVSAAESYVRQAWPEQAPQMPVGDSSAIDLYNRLKAGEEVVTVLRHEVQRSGSPAGMELPDDRPRCADCGEPLELERESDPESWMHAADANYFGDHSASVV